MNIKELEEMPLSQMSWNLVPPPSAETLKLLEDMNKPIDWTSLAIDEKALRYLELKQQDAIQMNIIQNNLNESVCYLNESISNLSFRIEKFGKNNTLDALEFKMNALKKISTSIEQLNAIADELNEYTVNKSNQSNSLEEID